LYNIIRLLEQKRLDSLTYETAYVERPIPDIARHIKWRTILDAPPTNSSSTTLQELKYIGDLTCNRSQKDIELIHIVDQDMDSMFKALLVKYELKYPIEYIESMYSVIRPIIYNIKSLWNRPRPYQLAKYYGTNISTIITDTHDTAAYPSGHTVYSKLVANILQEMYPQIAKYELNNIVRQTAMARVKQGVHYPSDNSGSIVLANSLFKSLRPQFRNYYYV